MISLKPCLHEFPDWWPISLRKERFYLTKKTLKKKMSAFLVENGNANPFTMKGRSEPSVKLLICSNPADWSPQDLHSQPSQWCVLSPIKIWGHSLLLTNQDLFQRQADKSKICTKFVILLVEEEIIIILDLLLIGLSENNVDNLCRKSCGNGA